MTDDRSLERAARSWLENGPTQAPDRAVATALLRIETTSQERDLGFPWRLPIPPVSSRLAAASIIGLLAIGGALLVLGGSPQPVVVPPPDPSTSIPPSPSEAAQATPRPTPTATITPLNDDGVIVFEHWTDGLTTRLEYLLPNGLGKELLPDMPGHQEHPAWSRDGTTLAFDARDPRDVPSRQRIWETDAIGGTPRLITADCTPPECVAELDPSYSADGGQMAFTRVAGDPAGPPTSFVIAIRDLTTGEVTELDSTRIASADGFVEHARFSPDGRRLTYTRVIVDAEDRATDSIIHVVNADGTGQRALTEPGFEAGDPEWSPDGARILFAREITHHWFGGGKGSADNAWIYTMSPDGSGRVRLTSEMSGAPSWAADGSQILFNAIPLASIGTPDIFVMGADGSEPRAVAIYGDCCRWYPVQQPTP